MSVQTTGLVNWIVCPDCGEETLEGSFTHEITCKAKNGLAHTSPIVDAEIIGSCEIEPPPPGYGEEYEFTCFICGSTVKQDASEDIDIDSRGNPICSKLCKGVSKKYQERSELSLEGVIDEACRVYAELDAEEAEHRAYYKARADALDRIVGLLGPRGHFQDDKGVVYELLPAKGVYVPFVPYEIRRTRRGDEKAGTLALKRAEELGYIVERKKKAPKQRKVKAPAPPPAPVEVKEDAIPF